MSEHWDFKETVVEPLRAREARASLSCARTLKRLSWIYRNWALEDAEKGDRPAYLKHAAEARRLWRTAKVHLDAARRFAHGS